MEYNESLNLNLNKYVYFMNHISFNKNESYVNISPIFTPIRFTKEINLNLYTLSNNDFEVIFKTNHLYNEQFDNIIDFPYLKYSEIMQITTELFPNIEFISEWNLNRFFNLDTFKIDNYITSNNEQYQIIKIFDDEKKTKQFRKLTEDLNNYIVNKFNMDEDDISTYGKFLDDFDYNFKFAFSEIQKFPFDDFISTNDDGNITSYNKEYLKEELYKRIKQKMSFDFVINRNDIKLNMIFERQHKRRSSDKNVTYLFTVFNLYDDDGSPNKIIIICIQFENDILSETKLNDYIESVNNQFLILDGYDFSDISFDLVNFLRINNNVGIKILDYDSEIDDYTFTYDTKNFTIYDQWNITLVDYNNNELDQDFYYKNLVIPYEQIIKEKVTPNNKTNIFNRNITHKQYFDNHKDKRKISILK